MNVISITKKTIRRDVRQKIKMLSAEEKSRQSDAVCKKILNSKIYKSSKNISVFLSLPSEINTSLIVDDILNGNHSYEL